MKKVLVLTSFICVFCFSGLAFSNPQTTDSKVVTADSKVSGTEATTKPVAALPKDEIIEINSIKSVVEGYPTLVLYGFTSCPYCVVEKRFLKTKGLNRLAGRMHIYHVDVVKGNFVGNKNPCGSGRYPQTQIFDKEAKQVACYTGFEKQSIIRKIWELTKVNLEIQ